MEFLGGFLLRILDATPGPNQRRGVMYLIIHRPYVHLEERFRRAFEGQEDVKIIVDRRRGDRRTERRPFAVERRKADRRGSKEEVVDVVVLGGTTG